MKTYFVLSLTGLFLSFSLLAGERQDDSVAHRIVRPALPAHTNLQILFKQISECRTYEIVVGKILSNDMPKLFAAKIIMSQETLDPQFGDSGVKLISCGIYPYPRVTFASDGTFSVTQEFDGTEQSYEFICCRAISNSIPIRKRIEDTYNANGNCISSETLEKSYVVASSSQNYFSQFPHGG